MLHYSEAAAGTAINPCISANPLENLTSRALLLYTSLRTVADKVSGARGYCRAVSQVHFFCPGEIVADTLGMARSTMYRKIAELKALDLIDARAHYVTHRGRTRADGMVWCVKMHPERQGPVKVPCDALKKSYRCLSADIQDGRTAWKLTKSDSHKTPSNEVDIEKILAWAVPPPTTKNLDMSLTVRPDLESVLDLPYVDKLDRREAVNAAAGALAAGLRDWGGLMFYRLLLWNLCRLHDRTGAAPFHQVHEQARRTRADVTEGFARGGNGGALFTARLKRAPFWDELARASGRVGFDRLKPEHISVQKHPKSFY